MFRCMDLDVRCPYRSSSSRAAATSPANARRIMAASIRPRRWAMFSCTRRDIHAQTTGSFRISPTACSPSPVVSEISFWVQAPASMASAMQMSVSRGR